MSEQIVRFFRERIPAFTCKPGCHDCCGPVAASSWEVEQMGPPPPKKRAQELECAFLGPDGCTVYAERPLLCRVFGTVPRLPCPHGQRPLVLLDGQTEAELNQFFRQTRHYML